MQDWPQKKVMVALPSSSPKDHLHRGRQWRIVIIFLFSNTKKNAMIACCRCLLRHNTTIEKCYRLFLLKHREEATITFFITTITQKRQEGEVGMRKVGGGEVGRKQKCERKRWWCLLLKPKEKKHREKKNAKKGGNLSFFSQFCIWDEALHLCWLSTFLQRWAPHLPQALCRKVLCYSSSWVLLSFGDWVPLSWRLQRRYSKGSRPRYN